MKPGIYTTEFIGCAGVAGVMMDIALDETAPVRLRVVALCGASAIVASYSLARALIKLRADGGSRSANLACTHQPLGAPTEVSK